MELQKRIEIKELKCGELIIIEAGINHHDKVMFLLRYKGQLQVRATKIIDGEFEVIKVSETRYKGKA